MKKLSWILVFAILMTLIASTFIATISAEDYVSDAAAVSGGAVCRIGDEGTGTYYSTLPLAFGAATNKSTITLIKNISGENSVNAGSRTFTLDGNGYEITGASGGFLFTIASNFGGSAISANVTVKNLSVKNAGAGRALRISENAIVNLEDCYIEGTVSTDLGVVIIFIGGTLNVKDTTIKSAGVANNNESCAGILFHGVGQATANIYSGTVIEATGIGIYAKRGLVNVYGGTISGGHSAAIYARENNSIVNVYDGDLTFTKTTPSSSSLGLITAQSGGIVNLYGGKFTQNDINLPVTRTVESTPTVNLYGGMYCGGSAIRGSGYVGAALPTTIQNAYPEGTNEYNLSPEMTNGASIRLIENSSGIRFISRISAEAIAFAENIADTGTISYGTVICPTDYLTYANGILTMDALDEADIPTATTKYLDIVANTGVLDNEDGSKALFASMVDVKVANYSRDFSAVSYIKYEISGEVLYLYSHYSTEDNSRNIQDISYRALADVQTTEGTVNGYQYDNQVSEYYVKDEETGTYSKLFSSAYSCYNNNQIAIITMYIL